MTQTRFVDRRVTKKLKNSIVYDFPLKRRSRAGWEDGFFRACAEKSEI
jgi:hypothetical protein